MRNCLAQGLWFVATWVPGEVLQIVGAIGSSVGKGVQEVFICVSPKGGMRSRWILWRMGGLSDDVYLKTISDERFHGYTGIDWEKSEQ